MDAKEQSTQITLRDGRTAIVRPLQPTDAGPLTTFFLNLSEETRRRYGPHPFDQATAEHLCATINERTIRFVAVLNDGTPEAEIIGYMILTREIGDADRRRYGKRLDLESCASFAPVIADVYQNQGIGFQMAQHVLRCAQKLGLRQVILMGGVQATNERARHFYRKLGFRQVGSFLTLHPRRLLNYDMILEFDATSQGEAE